MIAATKTSSECAPPQSVLIVEDDRISRRAMTALLAASGYPAQGVGSAEEALQVLDRARVPAIAVIDLDLPGMSGLELIARMEKFHPDVFPVLVTGADTDRLERLLGGRQVALMRKPVEFHQLLALLDERRTRAPLPHRGCSMHSGSAHA